MQHSFIRKLAISSSDTCQLSVGWQCTSTICDSNSEDGSGTDMLLISVHLVMMVRTKNCGANSPITTLRALASFKAAYLRPYRLRMSSVRSLPSHLDASPPVYQGPADQLDRGFFTKSVTVLAAKVQAEKTGMLLKSPVLSR